MYLNFISIYSDISFIRLKIYKHFLLQKPYERSKSVSQRNILEIHNLRKKATFIKTIVIVSLVNFARKFALISVRRESTAAGNEIKRAKYGNVTGDSKTLLNLSIIPREKLSINCPPRSVSRTSGAHCLFAARYRRLCCTSHSMVLWEYLVNARHDCFAFRGKPTRKKNYACSPSFDWNRLWVCVRAGTL